jgi:hypothetical protein
VDELLIHIRKDVKAQFTGWTLRIILLVLLLVAFIAAYMIADSWAKYGGEHTVQELQMTMIGFWSVTTIFYSLGFMLLGSTFLSSDKENGMLGYTMLQRPSRIRYLLSKMIFLFVLALAVGGLVALTFELTFLVVAGEAISLETLLVGSFLPSMALFCVAMIGLTLSFAINAKGAALALGIFLMIGLPILAEYEKQEGYRDIWVAHQWDSTGIDYRAEFPLDHKFLVALNPQVVQDGTYFAFGVQNSGYGSYGPLFGLEESFLIVALFTVLLGLACLALMVRMSPAFIGDSSGQFKV